MGLLRRRTIVLGGLAVAAAAVSAPRPRARTGGRYPFHLGVASGEPDSISVVLWTRLARDPLAAAGTAACRTPTSPSSGRCPRPSPSPRWWRPVWSSPGRPTRTACTRSPAVCARTPSTSTVSGRWAKCPQWPGPGPRPHPAPSDHHWPWLRLLRELGVGLLHRVQAAGRGAARPDPAPGRLHLRECAGAGRGPAARGRGGDHATSLT